LNQIITVVVGVLSFYSLRHRICKHLWWFSVQSWSCPFELWLSSNGFSSDFIFGCFIKIHRENSDLVEMEQCIWHFSYKPKCVYYSISL